MNTKADLGSLDLKGFRAISKYVLLRLQLPNHTTSVLIDMCIIICFQDMTVAGRESGSD